MSVEDFDVFGEAQVEPADAFHLIDLGVKVPDVVVALVGLDCLHGDSLPQPHAEEAVIDDVAAVVLVNQLLVSQRCESGFDAAQSWQAMFPLEFVGHRGLHLALAGNGQQQGTLIVGQGRVIVLKSGFILVNQLLNGLVNLCLADDIDSMIGIDAVHDGLQVPRLPIQLLVHVVEHRCGQGHFLSLK